MSAVASPPRVTPEDLPRMPDGDRYELVDGELREREASFLSSYVAGNVYKLLDAFVFPRALGWVVPEGTTYRCFTDDPNRVRKPDVSFIRIERLSAEEAEAEGHCLVAPGLAVEVISPKDLWYKVEEKVEQWLAAGVKSVWVVHPKLKRVGIHCPNKPVIQFREGDVLTQPELLPGVSCPVAEFFRLPSTEGATPRPGS